MKLSIAQRAEASGIKARPFLKKAHGGGCAGGREFPVAGELATDGHVVGMANDVNLAVGVLVQHAGDLLQNLLSLGFQIRLTGFKQDAVKNVDREFAAQFGDGDFLRLEGATHFILKAVLGLGGGFLFLGELADAGLGFVQLVA